MVLEQIQKELDGWRMLLSWTRLGDLIGGRVGHVGLKALKVLKVEPGGTLTSGFARATALDAIPFSIVSIGSLSTAWCQLDCNTLVGRCELRSCEF